MPKSLTIVDSTGSVSVWGTCRLTFLLILASLVYVAALATNELVQQFLARYVPKDSLLGYLIYFLVAILLVLAVAYAGCRWDPELIEYIDVSPLN